MPTINKPFLFKLVLVVITLAGLLFGAHELQARRIPEALLRQAERAADADRVDAAIHYLRQYLEFCPDDVDAHERLAGFLRRRPASSARQSDLLFLYDKILRLDPERDATRREALALCLKVGRLSDAAEHAEHLLKTFPAEAMIWQQLGTALTGLNRLAEARKAFEAAIARAPDDLMGHRRLAQLVWKHLDDPAGAKAVLDRMITIVPQDPEAYLVRARFVSFLAEDPANARRAGIENVNGALNDLRRVLELDPENADASLQLAEILQKGRDVPGAHVILRDVAALYPRDLRLVRGLAWLEMTRGNAPAAIAVLEDALKATPEGLDLLVPLADLLVQQGDTARTAEILHRLEARKAPPLQVRYLKARIAMREAKWPEAVRLLEELRIDAIKLPGLEAQLNLLLGSCYQRTADPGSEEKAYRRVANADGTNVPARVGLAHLYLNQGRFNEAAREYDAAARTPYAPGWVFAEMIRHQALQLRRAGAGPEQWARLEHAVAAAAPRFGAVSSEPVTLMAEVLAAEGKHREAVGLLKKEAGRRPGDARLWAALAMRTADFAGTAAGVAVVDEAQAASGDGPDVRLARAALYAREPGRVRSIEPLGERIATWPEADQFRLLAGLVEVFDETGDRAAVVRMVKRVTTLRASDTEVWLKLHGRAIEAGDAKSAAEARAALVRIEGANGPSVLLCDPAAGEKLVATFGPSPNRADACLALAKVRAAAGDTTAAFHLTERAFTLEPTGFQSTTALLALHCRGGKPGAATAFVARLAADPRWVGVPFRRLIAGTLARIPAEARPPLLAACRPFVEREPSGLGWLAEQYATNGMSAEVLPTLTAATGGPAATADDWLRLALHHTASGAVVKATEVMKAARTKLTPRTFFGIAAVFAETSGGKVWAPTITEPAERREFAQARLALKLSRSDAAGGAAVLEAYLKEQEIPAADAAWAKRNLAMLYAVNGSHADRRRAIELIRDVVDGGDTPEELRATASVLSTLSRYLESDDRKIVLLRAAAALEKAHKISKSPRDLFNLSQLHRMAGQRAESRKCLNALLQADAGNIYYLVAALEELTEAGEMKTGETFAKVLLNKHRGEFRAVAAVARFECKAGRPGQALALAEGYSRAADVASGDHLTRSARVAELLDELSRVPGVRGTPAGRKFADAAAERFAALVPARAEAVVAVAGVLAADGRVSEAFTRIEQYNRYTPKRVRAAAGLAAVRSGEASDRQFTLVKGWLDECRAEEPESVSLRLNMAEFLSLRQDAKGAAAVYEEVLKQDSRNVVALNNLAWLLAADPATAERALELIARATREAGLTGELLDTRARIRITLRQQAEAERDLTEALRQERTPLRLFHLALLRMTQSPPRMAEAATLFAEARSRGLDVKNSHPADLPAYRLLEAGSSRPAN